VIVSVLMLALFISSSMPALGVPDERVVKIGNMVALNTYGCFDCVRHINEQGTRWYQWCQVMS